MLVYLIPVFILVAVFVVAAVFVAMARVRGGRYLRPVIAFLSKIPGFKQLIQKASQAAIERYNPELAGAMEKLKRAGADKDPLRAQQALGTLSPDERKAWVEAAGQQGAFQQPQNRAERRAMERMQKGRMPSPQQKRRTR